MDSLKNVEQADNINMKEFVAMDKLPETDAAILEYGTEAETSPEEPSAPAAEEDGGTGSNSADSEGAAPAEAETDASLSEAGDLPEVLKSIEEDDSN